MHACMHGRHEVPVLKFPMHIVQKGCRGSPQGLSGAPYLATWLLSSCTIFDGEMGASGPNPERKPCFRTMGTTTGKSEAQIGRGQHLRFLHTRPHLVDQSPPAAWAIADQDASPNYAVCLLDSRFRAR